MKVRLQSIVKFIFIVAVSFFCIVGYKQNESKQLFYQMDFKGSNAKNIQLFYDVLGNEQWEEVNSSIYELEEQEHWQRVEFAIPENAKKVRVDINLNDLSKKTNAYFIKNVALQQKSMKILGIDDMKETVLLYNQMEPIKYADETNTIDYNSKGEDPFFIMDIEESMDEIKVLKNTDYVNYALISILIWIFTRKISISMKNVKEVFRSLIDNKKLITKLGYNDFKVKYASSYLGIIWGFVNPLINILVYWFVFQVAFKSGDVNGIPFILWFLCGIVPWFYFSEALNSATNSFIEYSYLVKKVKFKIDILPFIKLISSLFVHVFFVVVVFIVMAVYGYYPNIYNIQVLYYILCMIILVYAITIFTSGVVLFFRDLGQIIAIVLNVGFWFTPIGWNLAIIPEQFQIILKMNPMFYIVQGFRDSFVSFNYFWERPYQSVYFWFFIILMFSIGISIFKKLKPHFADVL